MKKNGFTLIELAICSKRW